jgi:hypothetical protein
LLGLTQASTVNPTPEGGTAGAKTKALIPSKSNALPGPVCAEALPSKSSLPNAKPIVALKTQDFIRFACGHTQRVSFYQSAAAGGKS